MAEDEARARQREIADLRWEIHELGTQKTALEDRLSHAIPESVGRIREQIGTLDKELLLATARLAYLAKSESIAESASADEEEYLLKPKPKKPKPKM